MSLLHAEGIMASIDGDIQAIADPSYIPLVPIVIHLVMHPARPPLADPITSLIGSGLYVAYPIIVEFEAGWIIPR